MTWEEDEVNIQKLYSYTHREGDGIKIILLQFSRIDYNEKDPDTDEENLIFSCRR